MVAGGELNRGVDFAGKWASYLGDGDGDGGSGCILWMVVPSLLWSIVARLGAERWMSEQRGCAV